MKRRDFITLNTLAIPGFILLNKFDGLHFITDPVADGSGLYGLFKTANGPGPYTLWQWMDGFVTKEGITYDLEAFKNAGITDVQQFLIGGSEMDIADPELTVMGEKWIGLMRFALDECQRLGMTFGTHNCPGWSASGAPGLQPEDSMQKIVWTKTELKGKDSRKTKIPQFEVDKRWNYYKDICVIALPSGTGIINREAILIIQDGITAAGQLRKKLPAGEWTILRFGHTTTGSSNGTAPVSGQGLEVDKMSKEALEKFWALYPGKLVAIAGHHAGYTFKRFEIDSFEAGEQTWTANMGSEFKERRGYDLLPWLPVLAGFTITDKETSSRFTYDWQKTIDALFAENYYGHLHTLINNAGMEFLIQPYGTGHINFDTSALRGIGDIVMCEFWWGANWGWDSVTPVTSNAHVNGRKIVAAEAFTGQPQFAWKVDLFDLKSAGDRAFCRGVNLFVLHASAHQPWPNVKPGMTMGWWGTQFGPSQTWWENGAPEWIAYLNRCQLLLQKGLFVADACFLHLHKQSDPIVPPGYKADICNTKEFLGRFDVRDKRWVLPDGMGYKVLVLPENCPVDVALARRIVLMVNKGGAILGKSFQGAPGLHNFQENKEILKISESLFGKTTASGTYSMQIRKIGNGTVYSGYSLDKVLELENIPQDVILPEGQEEVHWIHRNDQQEHYYFISNQENRDKEVSLSFRITGMQPELWNPETGLTIDAPIWETTNGRTRVLLSLEAIGSVFVVFKKQAASTVALTSLTLDGKPLNLRDHIIVKEGGIRQLRLDQHGEYILYAAGKKMLQKAQKNNAVRKNLNSDWEVIFQKDRGAPEGAVPFKILESYTERAEKGIKYFSGTAAYRKSFDLDAAAIIAAKALFLNLGVVKNIATVIINGKKVRTFWKPPFTLDITAYCIPGKNTLEVEVTNLWPNRMIGDEYEPDDLEWGEERYFKYVNPNPKVGRNLQAVPDWVRQNKQRPSAERITFSIIDFFDKGDPLLPSGLIGPVVLSLEDVIRV